MEMMRKKIFTVLLSLVMALLFAAPAFAEGEDTTYRDAHAWEIDFSVKEAQTQPGEYFTDPVEGEPSEQSRLAMKVDGAEVNWPFGEFPNTLILGEYHISGLNVVSMIADDPEIVKDISVDQDHGAVNYAGSSPGETDVRITFDILFEDHEGKPSAPTRVTAVQHVTVLDPDNTETADENMDEALNWYENDDMDRAVDRMKKVPKYAEPASVSRSAKKAYIRKIRSLRYARYWSKGRVRYMKNGLVDMNEDGVPELVVRTVQRGRRYDRIYTCKKGKVRYLGKIKEKYSTAFLKGTGSHSGLILYQIKGKTGERLDRVIIKNGKLVKRQIRCYGRTGYIYHKGYGPGQRRLPKRYVIPKLI